jgi:hypothetical protein
MAWRLESFSYCKITSIVTCFDNQPMRLVIITIAFPGTLVVTLGIMVLVVNGSPTGAGKASTAMSL